MTEAVAAQLEQSIEAIYKLRHDAPARSHLIARNLEAANPFDLEWITALKKA